MSGDEREQAGLRLEAVAFEVIDPAAVAAFWSALLDREVAAEPGGAWVPGDATQVGLRFVASSAERVGRPRLHLHLTSSSLEDQRRTVATVLDLGGRHLDVGQGADAGFVVMSDPGGNELCVIEPGDTYLAGTGFLGEVTCDGSRAGGTFWRDALGWTVVWDEGDQVAIQSPLGGTKIGFDTWDPPPERATARRAQRFDLVAVDPAAEAERLVSIGATHRARLPDGVALADPDGIEFVLRADPAAASPAG